MSRLIWWIFALMLGITPLLFYPFLSYFPLPFFAFNLDPTFSELFEVPKMFFVYLGVSLLVIAWSVQAIVSDQLRWRRTRFDVPIILGLISALCSTIFSIDWFGSVFGYPSRLHGGLLSVASYALLYWIYTWSSFSQSQRKAHIWIAWGSGLLVASYAWLQKFGMDRYSWNEDVQSRVFASLGQPNWLAAYLCGVVLLGLWLMKNSENGKWQTLIISGQIAIIVALIFSGSRGGLIGLVIGGLVLAISYLLKAGRFRWWWMMTLAPLLFLRWDMGASETAQIRLAVWQGSWEIVRNYPIFGSGVETFTYSFYQFRPTALLSTTEWGYLYNKAHSDIVHVAATTGIVGLIVYLTLLAWVVRYWWISLRDDQNVFEPIVLVAAWFGMWVSNQFGFSTVMVGVLGSFCLALMASVDREQLKALELGSRIDSRAIGVIGLAAGVLGVVGVSLMSAADVAYGQARMAQAQGKLSEAIESLEVAVGILPWHPLYQNELGHSYAFAARTLHERDLDQQTKLQLAEQAEMHLQKSLAISPKNTLLVRKTAAGYHDLSKMDPEKYREKVIGYADQVWELAPNDIVLRAGLVEYYQKLGEVEKAKELNEELKVLRELVSEQRTE